MGGVLPDIAALSDFVPGYEASIWVVSELARPAKTPSRDRRHKLNKEINAALADTKMSARLADLGGTVLPGSLAELGKFIADETEKWAGAVKFSGAKAE